MTCRNDHPSPGWKLVIYKDRKRIERIVEDGSAGLNTVKELADRGIKAHLVSRIRAFKPRGRPEDPRMWWCPYCRRWRVFYVPNNYSPFTEYEDRVCGWCRMSERDYHIRVMNHLDREVSKKRSRASIRRRYHELTSR